LKSIFSRQDPKREEDIISAVRPGTTLLGIANHDGAREVLKFSGGRIDIAPVETGISDRRNVEIVSGLDEGDLVVRDTGQDLADGTRVR